MLGYYVIDLKTSCRVIEEVLSSEGASKVVKRVSSDCAVLIAKFPEDSYIIALKRGDMTESIIAKVVPSTKATEVPWECGYLDYVPYGYYAVAENLNELKEKLTSKLRSLRRLVSSGKI